MPPPRRPRRCGATRVLLPVAIAALAACGSDASSAPELSPLAQEGREIAATQGCASCHGVEGAGGIGPAWTGLLGSTVELDDGSTVVADEAYLVGSITDPAAQITAGFDVSMPENDLDADQVAAIVAYIVELGS